MCMLGILIYYYQRPTTTIFLSFCPTILLFFGKKMPALFKYYTWYKEKYSSIS